MIQAFKCNVLTVGSRVAWDTFVQVSGSFNTEKICITKPSLTNFCLPSHPSDTRCRMGKEIAFRQNGSPNALKRRAPWLIATHDRLQTYALNEVLKSKSNSRTLSHHKMTFILTSRTACRAWQDRSAEVVSVLGWHESTSSAHPETYTETNSTDLPLTLEKH